MKFKLQNITFLIFSLKLIQSNQCIFLIILISKVAIILMIKVDKQCCGKRIEYIAMILMALLL